MRLPIATAILTCTGLIGLSPAHATPQPDAGTLMGGAVLRVANEKPEPATSDSARVAPGPSERNEPAAAEVRQTPVGGQTSGGTIGTPAAPEQDRRRD